MGVKNKVIANMAWKFAERITAQFVTAIVSIILARILSPTHYGLVAIVEIFITFANVFVSDGFGSALIQKKDADSLDFCSVLYFNISFSVLLYILLYLIAPSISRFYGVGYEEITPVLRVLGLRLILSAINSVQQAYVSKHMIFRKFFWATLLGTVCSAVVGITMAYKGYGVWALVFQYLTNTTVDTFVLNRSLKLKPKLMFSFVRLKGMLKYGSGILLAKLLITGYQELRALIIGKMYSSSELAYYEKGRQFPKLIVTNIDSSLGAVLFPKMSIEQSNLPRIKETTRNSIRFSSFVMCPLMLGLAAISDSFVKLILTEKWIACVPFMRMFCVIFLFQPIHTANMQAIKAIGRSDIYLRLELLKKGIELLTLILAAQISVEAIVINMAILTTLFTFINSFPNRKLLNYSFKEQMQDILPNIITSGIMFLLVFFLGKINVNYIIKMVLQILAGGIFYFFAAYITKNNELKYLVKLLKNKA